MRNYTIYVIIIKPGFTYRDATRVCQSDRRFYVAIPLQGKFVHGIMTTCGLMKVPPTENWRSRLPRPQRNCRYIQVEGNPW